MEFDFTSVATLIILISSLLLAFKNIKSSIFKQTDIELDKLNSKLDAIQNDLNMVKKVQFALLQHEITGDHINDMNKLYQELCDYMTKD